MRHALLNTKKMSIHHIFTCSIGGEDHEDWLYAACIRDTMKKLSGLPIIFYVVENNGKRLTLLDTIEGIHLIYTDSNKNDWFNGTKEFSDIQSVIELYAINDEDIVIKQTGRYTIERPTFIERVVDYESIADVFMKFYDICSATFRHRDCILGLYAVRSYVMKGYFKHLIIKDDACESSFASYIRHTVVADKVMEVRFLDMYFRGMASMHV